MIVLDKYLCVCAQCVVNRIILLFWGLPNPGTCSMFLPSSAWQTRIPNLHIPPSLTVRKRSLLNQSAQKSITALHVRPTTGLYQLLNCSLTAHLDSHDLMFDCVALSLRPISARMYTLTDLLKKKASFQSSVSF